MNRSTRGWEIAFGRESAGSSDGVDGCDGVGGMGAMGVRKLATGRWACFFHGTGVDQGGTPAPGSLLLQSDFGELFANIGTSDTQSFGTLLQSLDVAEIGALQ